ncbi:hypothetical protein [Kitasatospora sp. GP82]|uniref:hypothetical protein n=1 Tax=Kitasatospora sp. GP82 TaxID=3035089 RepID=UPI002475C1A1|nr:hypothetical protein [Kitasatospora sp. GP82]MDH6129768.1 hypothetical protein [Kitasatospora sp. GP82]
MIARRRGDEDRPLGFVPEVQHRFTEGPVGAVIPTACRAALHHQRRAADGSVCGRSPRWIPPYH